MGGASTAGQGKVLQRKNYLNGRASYVVQGTQRKCRVTLYLKLKTVENITGYVPCARIRC